MLKRLIKVSIFTFCLLTSTSSLHAETIGKIEVGPTYLHTDVLESGHTIKGVDFIAVKADAPFLVWKGVMLKPTALYGQSGNNNIFIGGCGIGHYTPLNDVFSLTPSVGVTYTQLNVKIPMLVAPETKVHLQERFHSTSIYGSLEATFKFGEGWRLIGLYQYAWSRTHTTIHHVGNFKSHSSGSSYGALIEKDINEAWSVSLGAAYNSSLSHEKHGIRGYGARLGLAYWY